MARRIDVQILVGVVLTFGAILLLVQLNTTHFSGLLLAKRAPDVQPQCVCPTPYSGKEPSRSTDGWQTVVGENIVQQNRILDRRTLDVEKSLGDGEGKWDISTEGRLREENIWQGQNDSSSHADDDDTVAKTLEQKVRVLCWILTCPKNLKSKTIHVKNTWTKRCNKVLFISSEADDTFPTVRVPAPEGRDYLTTKTRLAFKYIYDNHLDDADWFLKADDDTFVILENLRHFLEPYSPEEPVYFGHHFKAYLKQGYHSGGAGYVLSKEALRRLVEKGISTHKCLYLKGAEDLAMGRCMQYLGVKTGNTTDSKGRSTFHCLRAEKHLYGHYPTWYIKYDANGARNGQESMSDHAISFHYVSGPGMYGLEYFVYHLRPYGIRLGDGD